MRISVKLHITCGSFCTEKSVRTHYQTYKLTSKMTLLKNGRLRKFRGLKPAWHNMQQTFTPPFPLKLARCHATSRGYTKLDFFREEKFQVDSQAFLQLAFPKEKCFLQQQGYCTSSVCFTTSLVLPRNDRCFLLFSKGMRPPTCFSWLGFAVTAAEKSLSPVSGASNEQLVASAH